MPKQKIFIFIDWFLPGYKAGGPVRSMANMVQHLAEQYDFYILTRNTDYTETIAYQNIECNVWVSFQEGVKVYYADVKHQNKRVYKQLLGDIKPDVVYINGVYSWKYSILPLWVAKQMGQHKLIVASRGMLARSAIEVKGVKKKIFLTACRLLGLYKGLTFHVTNEKEKQDVKHAMGVNTFICIADNLPQKKLPTLKPIIKERGVLRLVSMARISPEKNTLFAIQRLADLGTTNGHIILDLYGHIYDTSYWRQCEQLITSLPATITVQHKGTVDATEVSQTIQDYHALFLPSRGENFGHVILESLSAGRPVLISDQTPWSRLKQTDCGWDLPLDDKGLWTSVLQELEQMDQGVFDVWCEGARKRAEDFVNDPALAKGYAELFS